MELKHATHEFPPLYDENSRILILGSFPSIRSREQKFFYGHPQNRFWKILAAVYEEKELLSIEEKREFALRHGIALYDSIEECDIPEVLALERKPRELDETILTEALERLNNLIGLKHAKQALTDYVSISRLRHKENSLIITPQNLCWDFIGKTGTGKSTIAEILGKLLQGLGILKRGHIVSVNADELTGDDGYLVLIRAIKESKDGLLFLDMDAPNTKFNDLNHLRMWIFNKLRELQQTTALVFAQVKAPEDMIAQNLALNGIASYGNSIVFDDFTIAELSDILVSLLQEDYQLDIMPEAKQKIQEYVESVKKNETKESPVNARTIFHLTQTIAHITQLRLAKSGGERIITLQDVSHFKWDNKAKGKVGFI